MIHPTHKTFHKSLRENLHIIVCRLSNIVDGKRIDNTITPSLETVVRKRSLAGKQAKTLSAAQIRTAPARHRALAAPYLRPSFTKNASLRVFAS